MVKQPSDPSFDSSFGLNNEMLLLWYVGVLGYFFLPPWITMLCLVIASMPSRMSSLLDLA